MKKLKFEARYIPNVLSVIRIFLVFVFLYFALAKENLIAALIVFLTAGATDVFDGFLARRNNWVSDLGKVLDPFADKLMQCTALIVLCIKGIVPIWFVIPFFIKDMFTLAAAALVIKRHRTIVVSKWFGKLAVCVFYVTVAASVIWHDFLIANSVIYVLLFIPAIILGIGAIWGYTKYVIKLKNSGFDLAADQKI